MALLRDRDLSALQATDRKPLYDTGIAPGSARDFARRMRLLLPQGWFPAYRGDEIEHAPVLQALLTGFGSVLAHIGGLMAVVGRQTRLGSLSGPFLDMAVKDFLGGSGLMRLPSEKDTRLRRRMVERMRAQRNTRQAITKAMTDLSGAPPRIIEPGSARDCGAWSRAGGYGVLQSRYGSSVGGQFMIEILPRQPIEAREIHAALRSVKACGVIAWVRMER